ncbi:protein kinase domain-containing protein [Schumannella soli]|uniref:non-specific serine/threonine protein kinase n=1 Tax=Schumannella soli TaxID=2590779 RepID=A0A506Y780_9MICO|nr:PASTA domain-containing protein [Schumannella soli]TPW77147.1 PASTA domain-containing protein [Schumannella soli]
MSAPERPASEQPDSDLIGGYRLGELSGSGATASVFAATHVATGERAALKVLHPHLSVRAVDRERFLAGAQHRVVHPNVIAIRGAGEQRSGDTVVCWIALDWADGEPLARRLRRGPLAPIEVRELAEGLLSALAAVHGSGLVHRDVSASNVLVPASGAVRAADVRLIDVDRLAWSGEASLGDDVLGLDPTARREAGAGGAEVADGGAESGSPGSASAAALAPRIVANPDYAAPEQLAGLPLDRRGDLFSAAAVLFAAATGHPPYRGARRDALLSGGVVTPPIASVEGADVPIEVDRALAEALAASPLRRPRDAEELRRRMVDALAGLGPIAAASGVGARPSGDTADDGVRSGAGASVVGGVGSAVDAPTRVLAAGGATAAISTAAISGSASGSTPAPAPASASRDARTEVVTRRARSAAGSPAQSSTPRGSADARSASARSSHSVAAAGSGATGDRVAEPAAESSRGRGGLIAAVAILLGVAGIATLPALADAGGTGEAVHDRGTVSAAPSSTPTPSAPANRGPRPTASTAPQPELALPDLAGMGLGEATSRLAQLGLEVGVVSESDSPEPQSTVLSAPASAPAGSRVDLVVASGRNRVPEVGGLTLAAARDALTAAGFGVTVTDGSGSTGDPGAAFLASGTNPIAGTSVAIGTVIELRVTSSTPSASPSPGRPSPSPSAVRGPS